jgi:hypothetical protein
MATLGSRKLSQLMVAMLWGTEKCILFPCLFLHRLPRQLRML